MQIKKSPSFDEILKELWNFKLKMYECVFCFEHISSKNKLFAHFESEHRKDVVDETSKESEVYMVLEWLKNATETDHDQSKVVRCPTCGNVYENQAGLDRHNEIAHPFNAPNQVALVVRENQRTTRSQRKSLEAKNLIKVVDENHQNAVANASEASETKTIKSEPDVKEKEPQRMTRSQRKSLETGKKIKVDEDDQAGLDRHNGIAANLKVSEPVVKDEQRKTRSQRKSLGHEIPVKNGEQTKVMNVKVEKNDEGPQYVCEFCPQAVFKESNELVEHLMNEHPNEKRIYYSNSDSNFNCSKCQFSANDENSALTHQCSKRPKLDKILDGPKKFKCNKCQSPFESQVDRDRHFGTFHKFIKHFCCKDCQFYTYEKSVMERHQQQDHHQGDGAKKTWIHNCSMCTNSYQTVTSFNNHFEIVHMKKYNCEACKFGAEDQLKFDKHNCDDRLNKIRNKEDQKVPPMIKQEKEAVPNHAKEENVIEPKNLVKDESFNVSMNTMTKVLKDSKDDFTQVEDANLKNAQIVKSEIKQLEAKVVVKNDAKAVEIVDVDKPKDDDDDDGLEVLNESIKKTYKSKVKYTCQKCTFACYDMDEIRGHAQTVHNHHGTVKTQNDKVGITKAQTPTNIQEVPKNPQSIPETRIVQGPKIPEPKAKTVNVQETKNPTPESKSSFQSKKNHNNQVKNQSTNSKLSKVHLPGHFVHNPGSVYPCNFCHKKFISPDYLAHHVNHNHKDKDVFEPIVDIVVDEKSQVLDDDNKNLYCSDCKGTFPNDSSFIDHMTKIHKKTPLICNICRFKSFNPTQQKLHKCLQNAINPSRRV